MDWFSRVFAFFCALVLSFGCYLVWFSSLFCLSSVVINVVLVLFFFSLVNIMFSSINKYIFCFNIFL